MTTGKPLLAVRNVKLTFGGITAIKDVSFEVEKGEFFAIIGPNGAGKTSMLNVLNGVYKPTSGTVEFEGQPLLGRKPADIARLGIARTFQNLALFEEMTVLDNVVLGRHHFMKAGVLSGMLWFGRARREEYEARRDCMPLIELMGLSDIRNELVRDLPYGVKKRIELARALAMRPKLLLLDEPVAGMNGPETAELASWVLNAKRELDLTIIMIEHDMALVTKVADRVLVLDFGEVICCDKPSVAVNDPRVIRAYIGGTDEKVINQATAGLKEGSASTDTTEKSASDAKKESVSTATSEDAS
ncbi:ABC transporter ATP-binding protein [Thermopolyspora flexuosa]|uniref:Amino acid/amide ABC transporter ATP-binding protein 1 (HAAT family) n=1 Tax=Thermopolyspora flexuosa TaxID=103836 RepID=A0A543IWY4_9ACTN|nr:ABC transporter ATP-binding protein [Thermopolyspora flexuosa]TQM75079.1 amino acid/amide ABC transporter ATP-binding protein 1 (HAAT family) [Thermopolyspora flexuosa]GGM92320.1 ABC transporter ATP-binding protein [Thermopolyspora flexuosa]